MSDIDFKKVDAAFQHLATDKQGQAELADFGSAIEKLKRQLPNLNDFESQYLVSALLQQRVGVQSNIDKNGSTARVVNGFVIKSAVTAN